MSISCALEERLTISSPTRHGSRVVLADQPDQLRAIQHPQVNLCIWKRTLSPQLQSYLDRAAPLLSSSWKHTLDLEQTRLDVAPLLHDMPAGPGRDDLGADLEYLCRLFIDCTQTSQLSVKLACFDGNLCERFHVDNVPVRLVCSYVGPGTEWLEDDQVDRRFLGPGAGGRTDEQSGLLLPGAVIHRLERFAVGLMKGERWPGNCGHGLVHRSPHGDRSVRRLLFKIDAVEPDTVLSAIMAAPAISSVC